MKKQDFDVEFAEEVLLRENEGQVTLPHRGRFGGQNVKNKKTAENKSNTAKTDDRA